jgi:hypothetical protein
MARFIDYQTKICSAWLNAVDDIVIASSPPVQITANQGQTTFPALYTPGHVSASLNGVHLNATDFSATTGTDVVLSSPAESGDVFCCYTQILRNTPTPG